MDGFDGRPDARFTRRPAALLGVDGPENRSDRLAQLAEMIAELAAALAEPDPPPAAEAVVLLDVEEAAPLLGISRAKLYDGPIKRGKLLAVLIDSRRLVPRSALDAHVTALIERAS